MDSSQAAKFTQKNRVLKSLWGPSKKIKQQGLHPLNFEQLYTVDDHKTHFQIMNCLAPTKQSTILIAVRGMFEGGCIVNYLKYMLNDAPHNVLFVAYQSNGPNGHK